jgi:hypothetical protein
MIPQTNRIAELNDQLRTTFLTGKVLLTPGMAGLEPEDRETILSTVRGFSDFDEDNDPHGEHDFGCVTQPGVGKVFWKIDYYDTEYQYGSSDPANPALTRRVLTIMLAGEY